MPDIVVTFEPIPAPIAVALTVTPINVTAELTSPISATFGNGPPVTVIFTPEPPIAVKFGYVLPVATTTLLGGVLAGGANITIAADGTISVTAGAFPPAFTSGPANQFWATPNGAAGVPALRAIVAADIPALSYQAPGSYITALTSDVTASGPGSVAATISAGAVSLAKMANLAAYSIIGNNTAVPAAPAALSVASVKTMLSLNNVTNDAQVKRTEMGAALGVATLDSGGLLPVAQLPPIAIVDFLGTVASQTGMLALTGQKGDWCIRSDLGTSWIITGANPAILAGWTQLSYPASPVLTVFGRTGTITAQATDYSAYYDVLGAAAAVTPTTLGLVIGTNTQAHSAKLDAFAALANSAGSLTNDGSGGLTWGAGGASPANPTATIGLAAVNGSAATFMRSDAAPALGVAITPTWTGQHIWSAGNVVSPDHTAPASSNLTLNAGSGSKNVVLNPTGTIGSSSGFCSVYSDVISTDNASYPGWQGLAAFGTQNQGIFAQRADGYSTGLYLLSLNGGGTQVYGSVAGGTYAAKTATPAGAVFVVGMLGYDGTGWGGPGLLLFKTTQAWTTSAHGGQILFYTTPNGSTTQTLALTIDQDQSVTLAGSLNAATIATGVWQGTAIADLYISSAATWSGKQAAYTNLTAIGSLANAVGWLHNDGAGAFAYSVPAISDVFSATQTANYIFAGPVSGAAAAPGFRAMVAADLGTTLTPQLARLGIGVAADATIALKTAGVIYSTTPQQATFLGITGAVNATDYHLLCGYNASPFVGDSSGGVINGICVTPTISTTNTTTVTTVYGVRSIPAVISSAAGARISMYGLYNYASRNQAGDLSAYASNVMVGIQNVCGHYAGPGASIVTGTVSGIVTAVYNFNGTVTTAYGYHSSIFVGSAGQNANPVISIYYDMLLDAPTFANGGTITTPHGIYQMNSAGDNYFAGKTGIGVTASTSTALNLPASTTSVSSLRIAHGAAPTTPVNGDIWTTTSGMYAQINGATVGPLGSGGSTAPTTLTYSSSVTPASGGSKLYRLIATGDLTLNVPSSPSDGDTVTIWITASGGARTVTLASGYKIPSASSQGSTIAIASGKEWIVRAVYDGTLNSGQWNLVSVIGGY